MLLVCSMIYCHAQHRFGMLSTGVCVRWRVHREVLPEELPKLALPFFGINVEGTALPAYSPEHALHAHVFFASCSTIVAP